MGLARFRPASVLLILAYSLLLILGIMHHEPWRDEAQTWLAARDLSIIDNLRYTRYDACPALWNLLLVPFAKAGLPYSAQAILNLLIAVVAVSVFVLRAPFTFLTKTFFIFSYYIAYEYAVIARHFMLAILLIFIIISFYRQRFSRPLLYSFLIFLLSNSSPFAFCFAFPLVLVYIWELAREKSSPSINVKSCLMAALIMCFSAPLFLLQVYPYPDSLHSAVFHNICTKISPAAPLLAVKNAFLPFIGGQNPVLIVLSLACLIFLSYPIFLRPRASFIYLSSLGALFSGFIFHMRGELRYDGFILIFLISGLWLCAYYPPGKTLNTALEGSLKKIHSFVLNIFLSFLVAFSIYSYYLEIRYYFSGAGDMAAFLVRNNLTQDTVVAQNGLSSSAILAYLPKTRFWYAGHKRFSSHFIFTRENFLANHVTKEEAIRELKSRFPDSAGRALLLTIEPLEVGRQDGFELLHRTKKRVFRVEDEVFYLYRYKGGD